MSQHQFYTNESNPSFLEELKNCLRKCISFQWSVSFIKKAGLVLFYDELEDALKRGVKGKIITSTYQNFTDIASLEMFLTLQEKYPSSFSCHLEFNSFGDDGFHTKGYIFSLPDEDEVLIGSSNITRFALLKNKEWDVSVITDRLDPFLDQIYDEFNYLYQHTLPLTRDIIKKYQMRLEYSIEQWDMDYLLDDEKAISPNLMQKKALKEISRTRSMGVDKALIVAATGSGKTYLAAFDARNFDSQKLLFVVHKDTILVEALKTFQRVFKGERKCGLYTGNDTSGLDCDFIFASSQMLLRHLEIFSSKEFDYIVIDEVHHAAAEGYRKILNYFKPEFFLGITATPERMDNQSIYELFGNNVPYDLRLREAMENSLIVPFKYFGIKDSLLSYAGIDTSVGIRNIIALSASSIHCEFIKEQIEKHRIIGTKLRAIGFCKSVEHARLLSEQMAELGYHTAYLSGSSATGERLKAFHDIEDENAELEIIFTIDILNEGVDIPSVNMVLFLRPTESSTIFIQQLGRGLRKYPHKEYLTVLDFIANSYRRSSQIALAFGSLSKVGDADKRTLKCYVQTNFASICQDIPGLEINMDEESREEILSSIDQTNFNHIKFLTQDFKNLETYFLSEGIIKKGEYIRPTDFLKSPVKVNFLRYAKYKSSYYEFLEIVDVENAPLFTEEQKSILRGLNYYLPLVRREEYFILSSLLKGPKDEKEIANNLKREGNYNEESLKHALLVLQGLAVVNIKQGVEKKLIKEESGVFTLNFDISDKAFSSYIEDALSYGLEAFEAECCGDNNLLHRFMKYTQSQSFLGLNVYKKGTMMPNLMPQQGIEYTEKGLAIYVTLNKNLQKEERLKYKDKFLSNGILQWESSTSTTLENDRGRKLIAEKRCMVFVRKTKVEDSRTMPYVYLGWGDFTNPRTSDNPAQTLLFDVILEQKVPEEYSYDFGIKDAD